MSLPDTPLFHARKVNMMDLLQLVRGLPSTREMSVSKRTGVVLLTTSYVRHADDPFPIKVGNCRAPHYGDKKSFVFLYPSQNSSIWRN